jgi:hypothetical protein
MEIALALMVLPSLLGFYTLLIVALGAYMDDGMERALDAAMREAALDTYKGANSPTIAQIYRHYNVVKVPERRTVGYLGTGLRAPACVGESVATVVDRKVPTQVVA